MSLPRARYHQLPTSPHTPYNSRRGADYSIDQLSRFLDREVRALMDRVVPKFDGLDVAAPEPAGGVDVRALMRGRFKG